MKKISTKEVYTVIGFKEYNMLKDEVMLSTLRIDKKISDKEAKKELDNRGLFYVNGTVNVRLITRIYKFPLEVISDMITALERGEFVDKCRSDYCAIKFTKGIVTRTYVNDFNIWKTDISEDFISLSDVDELEESRRNEGLEDGLDSKWLKRSKIIVPVSVYNELMNTYLDKEDVKNISEKIGWIPSPSIDDSDIQNDN